MIAVDTMRANVFRAPGEFTIEEVDRPRPGPGEALIRVTLTTICGTDVPCPWSGMKGVTERIAAPETGFPAESTTFSTQVFTYWAGGAGSALTRTNWKTCACPGLARPGA